MTTLGRAILGDGDPCPQDPAHGSLYFVGADRQRQWCPNQAHRGNTFYAYDGVTPQPHPAQSAPVRASTRRSQASGAV